MSGRSGSRPGAAARAIAALLLLALLLAAGRAAAADGAKGGDPDALRAVALAAANRSRAAHGLPPLALSEPLNAAAQAHAEDMLRRGYFGHAAPDGQGVRDRYLAQGGAPWHLVAENLSHCAHCPLPPDAARIERLQRRWMDSPPHRRNILEPGFDRFGFGIAGRGGDLYAVQVFAGPGTPLTDPRQGEGGASPREIAPPVAAGLALQRINGARQAAGLPPLQPSAVLDRAAAILLPQDGAAPAVPPGGLWAALPAGEAGAWAELLVAAAACGGCGTAVTDADIGHFAARWLDSAAAEGLLQPGLSHLGLVVRAQGQGRKVALLLAGRRR